MWSVLARVSSLALIGIIGYSSEMKPAAGVLSLYRVWVIVDTFGRAGLVRGQTTGQSSAETSSEKAATEDSDKGTLWFILGGLMALVIIVALGAWYFWRRAQRLGQKSTPRQSVVWSAVTTGTVTATATGTGTGTTRTLTDGADGGASHKTQAPSVVGGSLVPQPKSTATNSAAKTASRSK